jgi:hypothetical protein
VRGAQIKRIGIPQFDGWVVGGEIQAPRWSQRPLRIFSVHGPAGDHGYVHTMNEILDRLARIKGRADLVLGGDFNVVVGYRPEGDPLTMRGDRRDLLDRLGAEFAMTSCWQARNPGRPLAQTLRWSANPKTPYHCDGIFIPIAWLPRLRSCRVIRGSHWTRLSDHNPVLAELEVAPDPSVAIEPVALASSEPVAATVSALSRPVIVADARRGQNRDPDSSSSERHEGVKRWSPRSSRNHSGVRR